MPAPRISRRRVLTLIAGAALGCPRGAAGEASAERWHWRGSALGAEATIILHHPERAAAARAVAAAVDEIDRLEREFSLFRADSALCRLNAAGVLGRPSLDMQVVLGASLAVAAASDGAFDVSVQPLWQLYARHFATHPGDRAGPPAADVAAASARVDWRRLTLSPRRVALAPGMALTLNGIAQGYITDRIADLLRQHGWSHVLVNLGEIRALGGRPDGTPWRVGRAAAGERPVLELRDRAVATSAAAASAFEASGRHHHLFDPRTGASAAGCREVTVVADRAMIADALATALFVAPPAARRALVARFPGTACEIIEADGRRLTLAS